MLAPLNWARNPGLLSPLRFSLPTMPLVVDKSTAVDLEKDINMKRALHMDHLFTLPSLKLSTNAILSSPLPRLK